MGRRRRRRGRGRSGSEAMRSGRQPGVPNVHVVRLQLLDVGKGGGHLAQLLHVQLPVPVVVELRKSFRVFHPSLGRILNARGAGGAGSGLVEIGLLHGGVGWAGELDCASEEWFEARRCPHFVLHGWLSVAVRVNMRRRTASSKTGRKPMRLETKCTGVVAWTQQENQQGDSTGYVCMRRGGAGTRVWRSGGVITTASVPAVEIQTLSLSLTREALSQHVPRVGWHPRGQIRRDEHPEGCGVWDAGRSKSSRARAFP